MDPSNSDEALHEVAEDLYEGADIIMIKPGFPILISSNASKQPLVPVAVYQVSGEYAMIQAAHQNGWIDGKAVMMESLESMVRGSRQYTDLLRNRCGRKPHRLTEET